MNCPDFYTPFNIAMSIIVSIIVVLVLYGLYTSKFNEQFMNSGILILGAVVSLLIIWLIIVLAMKPYHKLSSVLPIQSHRISSDYRPLHSKFYEVKKGKFKYFKTGSCLGKVIHYEPIHHGVKGQPKDYIHTTYTKYYYVPKKGTYRTHGGYIIDEGDRKDNRFWVKSVERVYVPKDIHMTVKHPSN